MKPQEQSCSDITCCVESAVKIEMVKWRYGMDCPLCSAKCSPEDSFCRECGASFDQSSRNRRQAGTGKLVSLFSSLAVIVGFFMPWVTIYCCQTVTLSGFDIASNTMGILRINMERLWVIPVVAALVILALLFTGQKRITGALATVIVVLALTAGGILVDARESIRKSIDPLCSYKFEGGLGVTIVGLVVMALGAVADAFSKD